MTGVQKFKTISEMADLYGVSFRTLRFYEARGLLQPLRTGTVRSYSTRDRIRLELILKGKKLGFSLSEIARLIEHPEAGHAEAGTTTGIPLSLEQIEAQLEKLQRRKNELEQALEDLRQSLIGSERRSQGRTQVATTG